LAENQKSEGAGGNSGYRWYVLMDVKVVVAILLIAAVPLCALAQKPSAVTAEHGFGETISLRLIIGLLLILGGLFFVSA
jgi:hypothetical protein